METGGQQCDHGFGLSFRTVKTLIFGRFNNFKTLSDKGRTCRINKMSGCAAAKKEQCPLWSRRCYRTVFLICALFFFFTYFQHQYIYFSSIWYFFWHISLLQEQNNWKTRSKKFFVLSKTTIQMIINRRWIWSGWLFSFTGSNMFNCWLSTCYLGLSADCNGDGSLWAPLLVLQTTSRLHEYPTACLELEGDREEEIQQVHQKKRTHTKSLFHAELKLLYEHWHFCSLHKWKKKTKKKNMKSFLLTLRVNLQPENAGVWVPQRPPQPITSLLPPLFLQPATMGNTCLLMDLQTSVGKHTRKEVKSNWTTIDNFQRSFWTQITMISSIIWILNPVPIQ